jgi:hypothetical protein
MSETPRTETSGTQAPGAAQVPPQTRGQEGTRMEAGQEPAAPMAPSTAEPTGWYGWVVFASMLMVMVGAFQAIVGLTAIFNSGYYVVPERNLVVNVDYAGWGWVHLGLGVVAVAAAFGLLVGQMWARIVGIAMAVVSAVINLAFIGAYPWWSLAVIALDVMIIYAIAMHGAEGKAARH